MEKAPAKAFFGRQEEIRLLREKNWRSHAQLIVVYGRRRVGKTALVEQAFSDRVLWKFEGLEGESPQKQIQNFIVDLSLYTQKPQLKEKKIRDWREAFGLLAGELEQRDVVVFFDEFQWLACMKPAFVSLFKFFWDNHFRKNRSLRFVLCGSVSSFIVKKVLKSRSLYGRVDTEINLSPLTLQETGLFFGKKRSPEEILQIYMIFGGVPLYLEELNPDFSLVQNLDEYAFRQNGFFFQEYRRLFISHFASSPVYEKILNFLSRGSQGADEIGQACDTKSGGSLTQKLLDLELAGFVKKEFPVQKGHRSKLVRYRLDDEYLHFYFRFILPHIQEILAGRLSMSRLINLRDYQQWLGYAFERLCLKHAACISRYLQFAGIQYKCGSWFQREPTIQVDLLFERADKVLTICEMKSGTHLKAKNIVDDFEKKSKKLSACYPSWAQQKILLLRNKLSVPAAVKKYFDRVLFAENVFFGIPSSGHF